MTLTLKEYSIKDEKPVINGNKWECYPRRKYRNIPQKTSLFYKTVKKISGAIAKKQAASNKYIQTGEILDGSRCQIEIKVRRSLHVDDPVGKLVQFEQGPGPCVDAEQSDENAQNVHDKTGDSLKNVDRNCDLI